MTPRGIMDIVHRAGEVMKFRPRLATLQLALRYDQTSITPPPRGSDVPTSNPAHPSKTRCLHSLSPNDCPLRSQRETPEPIRSRVSTPTNS
jgi:hypothetical protein